VKVHLSAIESNINTVAAAIFCEPGMKWLVDVADEMGDEPQGNALLIAWRIR
jgi:hypothetical protein